MKHHEQQCHTDGPNLVIKVVLVFAAGTVLHPAVSSWCHSYQFTAARTTEPQQQQQQQHRCGCQVLQHCRRNFRSATTAPRASPFQSGSCVSCRLTTRLLPGFGKQGYSAQVGLVLGKADSGDLPGAVSSSGAGSVAVVAACSASERRWDLK
jgi:hypothetical protein